MKARGEKGFASVIETERLALTVPVAADLADVHALMSDERVIRFIGSSVPSREDNWNKLLRNIGHWDVFGYGIFIVREKESGEFVGQLGLAHFERSLGDAFDPYPEANWALSPTAQGKGYALEAMAAVHLWMSADRHVPRTVCIINRENTPSIKLAQRQGYQPFGEVEYKTSPCLMLARRQG